MIWVSTLLPLLTAMVSLLTAGYVAGQQRDSWVNKSFIRFSFIACAICLADFSCRVGLDGWPLDALSRILSALAFLVTLAFLDFMYALVGKRRGRFYWYSVSSLCAAAAASAFFAPVGVHALAGGIRVPSANPVQLILFVVASLPPSVQSVILCAKLLRCAVDTRERARLWLLLVGILGVIVYETIGVLVLPAVFGDFSLVKYSSLGLLWQSILTYLAVTRHNFLTVDIERVEEMSRRLFADAQQAILVVDAQGIVAEHNEAAAQLFGFAHTNSSPRRIAAILPNYAIDGYSRGEELDVELLGKKYTLRVYQSTIRQRDAAVGSILFVSDLTHEKIAEKEMLRTRQIESLGVMAGGIAHDFNNFLTGISAGVGLLKDEVRGNTLAAEIVADIQSATRKATGLARQLLTFAKGSVPEKTDFSLREVVEETLGFCLRGTNIAMHVDIPVGLPAIRGDHGQISQVFQNLTLNALAAMPKGGEVTVSARDTRLGDQNEYGLKAGEYCEVLFADSGTGIAPENIEKVFDPYFSTREGGSGLGLSICYTVMKRHDGHISVESTPGSGCEFTLLLPLWESVSRVWEPAEPPVQFRGSGRVLIMDDEDIVRMVLSRVLEKLGYAVDSTRSGQEALEVYNRSEASGVSYQAVVADLTVIGGMGGIELARELRKRNSTLKIVVSSGHTDSEALVNYREQGFVDVIRKPYTIDEVKKVMAGLTTPVH